jgi:hypothetical protein
VFGVASLALGLGVPQGHWQNVLLAAVAVLLSVTIWNRGKRA